MQDPFFDVYSFVFHVSKWTRVKSLKTIAYRFPDPLRELIEELADFWMERNDNERRKAETLERDGEAFYFIKMYRDLGFSIDDSVRLASWEVKVSETKLMRSWNRKDLAKAFKSLPRIAPKMLKSDRGKLYRKKMQS